MDAFTWIVIGFLYLSPFVIFPPTSFITSAQLYLAVVSTSSDDFLLSEPSGMWDFFFERFPVYFKSHLGEIPFNRNLKMPFGVEAIFPHFQDWLNSLWVACLFFMDVDIRTNFPLTSLFSGNIGPIFVVFFPSIK